MPVISKEELTRLRSDLEKAKEALKPFADAWKAGGERDASPKPVDFRTAARILSQLENSK